MAQQLKLIYNDSFFSHFLKTITTVYSSFDSIKFLKFVLDKEWNNRELKDRMHHIAISLNKVLPSSFTDSIEILVKVTKYEEEIKSKFALEYMFIPQYIEIYGINDIQTSVSAIEKITQYTSCEFAVRPFIKKYPNEMIAKLIEWSKHTHSSVRRNASEGCRPRLPWAMALPEFKKNPNPILPILENLKDDSSEYVRKSVANNLNDISKDHPELIIELSKKWKGTSPKTDWILKHGNRTLLKSGNIESLSLFGLAPNKNMILSNFVVHQSSIRINEYLSFSFCLENREKKPQLVRLEYKIYYQKANGNLTPKVYKISEKEHTPGSINTIEKRQSFKLISTRKFHKGKHQIAIIVNGIESNKIDFNLI